MYIILSPHEYYIVLPALAINVDSKPRQGLPPINFAHGIFYITVYSSLRIHNTLLSVGYTLLRCAISTMYNPMIIIVLCADEL